MLNDLYARLLPPPLQVETLTLEDHGLTLDGKVTAPTAPCPTCAQPAARVHSGYRRTLADLPWATLPVCLSWACGPRLPFIVPGRQGAACTQACTSHNAQTLSPDRTHSCFTFPKGRVSAGAP